MVIHVDSTYSTNQLGDLGIKLVFFHHQQEGFNQWMGHGHPPINRAWYTVAMKWNPQKIIG
jgi:hypothetical protein